MLALWIVVGVTVAVLVVGLLVFLPRRARGGAAPVGPRAEPEAPSEAPPEAAAAPVEAPAPSEQPAPPLATTPPAVVAEPGAVGAEAEIEPRAEPELRERLGKTRGLLSGYVRALRARSSVDEQTWEELEEGLLRADVGVATTSALIADLRDSVRSGALRGPDAVLDELRDELRRELDTDGATSLAMAPDATT
ncbi:MAG TPA: signal recognition particle receptor subunit alpha, partial [Candidatus Binatus sp.]|nr:signal recognition particle receptor subunit alpha [Candidatus Binatus sp.]